MQKDLQHLFDDQGIDATSYEEVVDFRDPITKYANLSGYLFNIAFLKKVSNLFGKCVGCSVRRGGLKEIE